ncbi:MAG: transcriptional repressor [Armatimonadetes bacterium]|nr:transcriptional repressor [Armatimonadota bacterium]MCA1995604.1 transcriptional repressor [Armatimonadota bacterium]
MAESFDCNLATPAQKREFEEKALGELKARGYRMTMTRLQVIRALGETHRALSPYEIHDRIVQAGGRIDVVSVYRILATLEETGLAHHVASVNGYIPCRASEAHGFQQRLVCRRCGCVTEVALPQTCLETLEGGAESLGFQVETARLELIGLCGHCVGAS